MKEAAYTVKQVSDLSGANIRALHHYENVGLLTPTRRKNGYRQYDIADLERLQQIMLYRECGVGLADIKYLLDAPSFDRHAALQQHLVVLEARRQELDILIQTVVKTIQAIDGGQAMSNEELFEGLKRKAVDENERKYGAEARRRHGDAVVDAANEKLLGMDQQQWSDKDDLEKQIVKQLTEALHDGDADSAAAHALAKMHEHWIRMQWPDGAYSKEAHLGLARGYLQDPRFKAYYDDRAGKGATEFLVQALENYLT